MINNILLKFLGLRNFCETTQENETQSMPWQKTKNKISNILFRTNLKYQDNCIKEAELITCIDTYKQKQKIEQKSINKNISDASPISIYSAHTPTQDPLSQVINFNYHKNEPIQTCNINYLTILSWIYSLFILLILSISIVWYIIKSFENTYYLPHIFFYSIYPVQYILSIIYYSSDHYDKLSHEWDHTIHICNRNISKKSLSIICITLFSVILSFTSLGLAIEDIFFPEYEDYMDNSIVYCVLLFEWIYGRTMILLNLFVFFFTFHTHINEMKKNVDFLEKSNWVFYKDTKRISDICVSIIIKKYELEESIDKLQNIFSSATVFGTIGFALTIVNYKNHGIDTYLIILCCIYIIIQLYFFIIITIISEQQSSMKKAIRHPIFTAHWLKRIKLSHLEQLDNNEKQFIIGNENGTSIDWIILNTILNDKWITFEFCGLQLNDGELIKRCFGLGCMILSLNKISIDNFLEKS